jgi:hypothetical protein
MSWRHSPNQLQSLTISPRTTVYIKKSDCQKDCHIRKFTDCWLSNYSNSNHRLPQLLQKIRSWRIAKWSIKICLFRKNKMVTFDFFFSYHSFLPHCSSNLRALNVLRTRNLQRKNQKKFKVQRIENETFQFRRETSSETTRNGFMNHFQQQINLIHNKFSILRSWNLKRKNQMKFKIPEKRMKPETLRRNQLTWSSTIHFNWFQYKLKFILKETNLNYDSK